MRWAWHCLCASFAASCLLISCASEPKSEPQLQPPAPEPAPVEEYKAPETESVALALPPKKNLSYFSSVDEEVLAAVETGSPESLRKALTMLRRTAATADDSEKVLFNVAYAMLQITWPEEVISVELPAVTAVTPYLGAVDSARQGVYDSSTGNVDFLTLTLPSLVLLTSKTRNDYYAESEEALKKALEKREDSVFALYLLATLYMRQDRLQEALASFARAAELAPDCYECLLSYGEAAMQAGDAVTALSRGQALLEKYPHRVPVLGLCAQAAFASGDFSAAEAYVARVLQQEPDNAYYVLFRAKILMAKNEFIKAASLLDVYARTDTSARDYLLLRSRVQKEWNRNVSAAVKTIEQALTLYPDDSDVVLQAATLASDTGVTIAGKSAEELAAKILERQPENLAAMRIQVASLVQKKKWAEAYRVSAALLEKDRQLSLATHIDICLESGHADEAWKLASALYSQKSDDESARQLYIKVLVATNRSQEAARLISQLLPSASTRMKSFLYYQRSFLAASEDATFADLRSSLTANPRNKDALFRLYSIYYKKKDWRKAQYYLKQVVALSPTDESLLALNRELDSLLAR